MEEAVLLARQRLLEHAARLPVDGLWSWVGGDLYIDPCPPALQTDATVYRPIRRQLLRPQPFDTTDGAPQLPYWFDSIGTRRLVYVGLGTVMNRWHGLLERLVAELRHMDVDLVVTTGPSADTSRFEDCPPNVHVEQYIPLTALLPRCDVVVCHAGWGTTIAALAQGVPVVAIPLGADQPRTAARCEAAGFGRVVAVDAVGTGAVAAAVDELLHDRSSRAAAAAARAEIESMPAAREAVAAIEEVQVSHRSHSKPTR